MTIIKSVAEDEDVLFYWSMNPVDIEEESHCAELLSDIISLWITLRGFSVASTWMEEYKQATKTTKAKHSLRKGSSLKMIRNATDVVFHFMIRMCVHYGFLTPIISP